MPRRRSDGPLQSRQQPGGEFATYVADMFALLGPVRMGRLFSGYGYKLDGVQFAMILRGTLYLRVDAELEAELSALGSQPFGYQTKQRSMTIRSYWAVPEDRLDDTDLVLAWARRAIAAALANASRRKPKRLARAE